MSCIFLVRIYTHLILMCELVILGQTIVTHTILSHAHSQSVAVISQVINRDFKSLTSITHPLYSFSMASLQLLSQPTHFNKESPIAQTILSHLHRLSVAVVPEIFNRDLKPLISIKNTNILSHLHGQSEATVCKFFTVSEPLTSIQNPLQPTPSSLIVMASLQLLSPKSSTGISSHQMGLSAVSVLILKSRR